MSESPDPVRMLARGDPLKWFDELYRSANGDLSRVPWADRRPNRNLVSWLEREKPVGRGRSCVVVGCGLGDDAELLDRHGFKVTAFDISPAAIDWARQRFPSTRVAYEVADLFAPSPVHAAGFDFVFESYTVQALPYGLRDRSIAAVAALVAPAGRLLVIARGREPDEYLDANVGPPWPLTFDDIRRFESHGLRSTGFEDYHDEEDPPVRRFRATFAREM
jgi:SAM-dependent methyltransferase